jgi:hypothetical protein
MPPCHATAATAAAATHHYRYVAHVHARATKADHAAALPLRFAQHGVDKDREYNASEVARLAKYCSFAHHYTNLKNPNSNRFVW